MKEERDSTCITEPKLVRRSIHVVVWVMVLGEGNW
jgi:hypothetical protein